MNLFRHAKINKLEHSAATCKNNVSEQVLANVLVALHDRVVGVLVDTILSSVCDHAWSKKELWAFKLLLTDSDLVTTWKFASPFLIT